MRNLGKRVAVLAVVHGSKTVEMLATQDFSTLGTRAYRPAKHGHGPGQPSVSRKTLVNKEAWTLRIIIQVR